MNSTPQNSTPPPSEFERRLKASLGAGATDAPAPDPAEIRRRAAGGRTPPATGRRLWVPVGAAAVVAALVVTIALVAGGGPRDAAGPASAPSTSPAPTNGATVPGTTGPQTWPSSGATSATAEAVFPAVCPPTRKSGGVDLPEAVQRMGGDWFGRDDLWVNIPRTIPEGGTKFGTVTLDDHGDYTDEKGTPSLTAQRVGGTETATATLRPSNYSSEAVRGHTVYFWPTVLELPRGGTWLVTQTLGDTRLQYCVAAGSDASGSAGSDTGARAEASAGSSSANGSAGSDASGSAGSDTGARAEASAGTAANPSAAPAGPSPARCVDATGRETVTQGVLTAGPFMDAALALPAGTSTQKLWVSSQRPGSDDAFVTVTDPHGETTAAIWKGGEASIPTAQQFFVDTIGLTVSGRYTIHVQVGADTMCVTARYSVG